MSIVLTSDTEFAADPGYDDPEGHAAMLEAYAERPERCIGWAAAACAVWIIGGALLAVFQ